jgi:hypothetical protein
MSPPEGLLHVAGVLAGVFDALAVPYAFGGALAQNYWGTVRATQDIDLLASVPKIRFDDLREALVAAEFVARAADGTPVALSVDAMAAEERDRHLITVYRGLVKVEVFFPFLPSSIPFSGAPSAYQWGGERSPSPPPKTSSSSRWPSIERRISAMSGPSSGVRRGDSISHT